MEQYCSQEGIGNWKQCFVIVVRLIFVITMIGLLWWLSSEESACNTGDSGSISALGRSPGEGNDNPLQCFAQEISWTEEPGQLSMGESDTA